MATTCVWSAATALRGGLAGDLTADQRKILAYAVANSGGAPITLAVQGGAMAAEPFLIYKGIHDGAAIVGMGGFSGQDPASRRPPNPARQLAARRTIGGMRRRLFEAEHEAFRESVRTFLTKEVIPHAETWEANGIVPRELFTTAGAAGFLGMAIPEEFGGGGVSDFRFNAVLGEEIMRTGAAGAGLGLTLHNDICLPYFLDLATDEQRRRWLPGIASGTLITAIAMSEPGIGSDLAGMATTAVRRGDHYLVNGSKTFVSSGINADLVITAVKTDPRQRHQGMSLLVVERGMAGFERGRNLAKLGQHAQDTAELFFHDVKVPAANLLGDQGRGFAHLVDRLPQERLSMAVSAVAGARSALDLTLSYVKDRKAFGAPIGSFQNSRFRLAEMDTEIDIAQTFTDRCIEALNDGELTVTDAAKAKWWCTELQGRVVDACLQLHGGYGYMLEYPISRAFADARVTRIYGGTTEIMKEVISRSLGL